MPPIIGTAMRCMTSEPVPVLHRIGTSPAMMATTVIIFGRTRSTAPSMIASLHVGAGERPTFSHALGRDLGQRVVEIDQHHDAGFGGDARKRDEADRDGDGHIEASSHISQTPPTSAKGSDSMTISVSVRRRKFR